MSRIRIPQRFQIRYLFQLQPATILQMAVMVLRVARAAIQVQTQVTAETAVSEATLVTAAMQKEVTHTHTDLQQLAATLATQETVQLAETVATLATLAWVATADLVVSVA
jgi:hypothetical protein